MTANRGVLARESPYSPVKEIGPLEPDGTSQGFLSPSSETQDSRGKHKGLVSCRSIVRQNLDLVSHVVRQPPERRDPEKDARKKSKDSHAEWVSASDVSQFVGED